MPIHWIIGLFIGVFVGAFKLLRMIINALFKPLERKLEKAERDEAFGKLDNDIEIYDPNKENKNAD